MTCFEKLLLEDLLPDGVEVGLGGDVNDVVGDHGAAVDGSGEFDEAKGFFLCSGFEDVKLAVFGSDPDFAIGNEGGSPDAGLGLVLPVLLAGFGVVAMDVAIVLGGVEKAIGYAEGGDGAAHFFRGPDDFSFRIEAEDAPDAVAVLGILSDDDVGESVGDDGGADHFTGAGVSGVFDGLTIFFLTILLWVTVDLPEFFEDVESVFVFDRLGIKSVGESVAATPDDGVFAADLAVGG
jgi:hypothetical protein